MFVTFFLSLFFSFSNQQVVPLYPIDSTSLIINADIVNCGKTPPIVENNQALLPISIIKKHIDENIFWDEKMRRVVITGKDKVLKITLNNDTALMNNKPVKCSIPARLINGEVYIPIEPAQNIYAISVKANSEHKAVIIDYNQNDSQKGMVIKLISQIRKTNTVTSPIIKNLMIGNEVEVYNDKNEWYKVKSKEGIIGFVQKKDIYIKPTVVDESKAKQVKKKEKLILAWDQTLNINSINKIDGVQILSPVWFSVINENGEVKSKADKEYVKKAHENGYKVWALFSNSFSPVISSRVLNNGALRDKVINQIVEYSKEYELDGINIDFENMSIRDKDMFVQFVRELAPMLRAEGKVVSVDVGVPFGSENFSGCYDRKALGKVVDYVALMTYDQHWSNCPSSGSVAQYSWVEDKLKATLEEVPPEKLLLGIPFYVRGWKEEIDVDGAVQVTQYDVFSMNEAKAEVKANKAEVRWDNSSGQFYAQFCKDNATYKLWLEDENSVNLKSSLVQKYNLAGAAVWEKSFAKPEAWMMLKENIQLHQSYEDWKKGNQAIYARLNEYYLSKR